MRPGVLVQDAPAEFASLGPLPVRVRNARGEIVSTGVTGTPIPVPVGSYYVTILVPDGREVGVDRRVRAVPPEAAAASAPLPAPPLAPLEADMPESDMSAEMVRTRIWSGDWLDELARGLSAAEAGSGPYISLSNAPTVIPQEDGSDRLLIMTLEDRYRCTILPYDECIVCLDESSKARAISATVTNSPEGPVIDYRSTVSDETNGLLGFVESGVLTNMVAVTEDQVRRGEAALIGQGASSLRAVTGAYILLRANALEGVEDWLNRLEHLAASLPDLWPLRLELYARQGDHERAVQALIAAIASGRCPWFRAGLSYMLERLRLYIDVTENGAAPFNLGRRDYLSFKAARDGLERLMPMMLTSRYIATFDLPRPPELGSAPSTQGRGQ